MIAPDQTTFERGEGRVWRWRTSTPRSSAGARAPHRPWRELRPGRSSVDAGSLLADGHLGDDARDGRRGVADAVPDPDSMESPADRESAQRALTCMALEPATPMIEIPLERVFIGPAPNSRIEDLRRPRRPSAAARSPTPWHGVGRPRLPQQWQKQAAEAGGPRREVFRSAGPNGAREAGCSMCLGDEPDILMEGERASTSNRNFAAARVRRAHPSAPRARWSSVRYGQQAHLQRSSTRRRGSRTAHASRSAHRCDDLARDRRPPGLLQRRHSLRSSTAWVGRSPLALPVIGGRGSFASPGSMTK